MFYLNISPFPVKVLFIIFMTMEADDIKEKAQVLKGAMGTLIFTVVECAVFLLLLVGIPLAQFKARPMQYCLNQSSSVSSFASCIENLDIAMPCYTMWGYKENCAGTAYIARGIAAFECPRRRNTMNAAAAFSIISLFLCIAIALGGLMLYTNSCQSILVVLVLTVIAVFTHLISWACVADVYNSRMCGLADMLDGGIDGNYVNYFGWSDLGTRGKDAFSLGSGFALLVISWCAQLVNCVIVAVLFFSSR